MSVPDDSRVHELARAAGESAKHGSFDVAARLWEQVLALKPAHAGALGFLGQHKLHSGDYHGARLLLECAASVAPDDAVVWLNLSFVHRALGDATAEMGTIQRALEADPFNLMALLAKGMLLERGRLPRQAARAYKDALAVLPLDDRIPTSARAAVAHARERVEQNSRELRTFLEDGTRQTRERFAAENLKRFDECLGIASGTKKIFVNQMTGLHFPQLPAIGFYEEGQLDWLTRLGGATETICKELGALLQSESTGFGAYVQHPPGVPLNQWSELNYSPRWSAYFLWQDGVRNDEHCAQCPQTAALLESLPMVRIEGFAPAAFFSVLAPRTRIPAHTGVTNIRLIVHTPLIVPAGCGFRVGNETRQWEIGRPFVFDDTIEHAAWNDSDQTRVVLIFDIWNPYLTKAERELVSGLLQNMREYYRG